MNYQIYLKSSHWQALKCKAYSLYGKYCCICSWKENLQVHHLWYDKNYDWGNTQVTDLRILCDACHERYHEETKILFNNPKEAIYNFETFRRKSGTFVKDYKKKEEIPQKVNKKEININRNFFKKFPKKTINDEWSKEEIEFLIIQYSKRRFPAWIGGALKRKKKDVIEKIIFLRRMGTLPELAKFQ